MGRGFREERVGRVRDRGTVGTKEEQRKKVVGRQTTENGESELDTKERVSKRQRQRERWKEVQNVRGERGRENRQRETENVCKREIGKRDCETETERVSWRKRDKRDLHI